MRFQFLAITCMTVIALGYAPICLADGGKKKDRSTHSFPNAPQEAVVCTGWHALCTASPDCSRNGDCDCMRVNEAHIMVTSEIKDSAVKRMTQVKCTNAHPCAIDQAPVCAAIRSGQYEVDNIKYDWVSTYSYRAWCALLQWDLIACYPDAPGYTGDSEWTICDGAPCTENQNPSDPERPLVCRCQVVKDEAFVGMKGSCTGDNGGIMSSMPVSAWDFEKNTYPFPMPGYEYVQGACAPLKSDPWKEPRRNSEIR